MKHIFIINPAAGSRDRTAEYTRTIERAGLDCEIHVSQAPGDCAHLARQAAETGEEVRLYACGGDGTLNEVVTGAAGFPNAAVTAYCGGSGNDFVRIFDQPEAFCDLDRLLDCEETRLDLIRCNDAYSVNICSVGLDARIGTDVGRYKRLPLLHGFRAYAVSAVVNVLRGIGEHYVIEVDGQTLDGARTLVCACNGRYYGGGFNPVPEADPADGLLDILVVEQVSRLQVPGVIGKYKNGRYRELSDLAKYYRTDKITIHCDHDTPINLDGELLRARDIEIRVEPQALRFFHPRGLTCRPRLPVQSR